MYLTLILLLLLYPISIEQKSVEEMQLYVGKITDENVLLFASFTNNICTVKSSNDTF